MGKSFFGLLLVGLIGTFVTSTSASAHGALAIGGNTSEVATKGIAFGDSYNYNTKAEADARALQECEKRRAELTVAPCQIIADFTRQWVFISMDPAAGTPGFGWSVDTDRATAEGNAINQCKASSPDDRKQFCVVSQFYHDEKP